jgi:hypothetical protein
VTPEFDHTREAFATSALGRVLTSFGTAAEAAWTTSRTGRVVRGIRRSFDEAPPPARIRAVAIAVMAAAAMQPLLILAMPVSVAPALPWQAFVLAAVFAGIVAWRAEAMAAAWPASRVGRRLLG